VGFSSLLSLSEFTLAWEGGTPHYATFVIMLLVIMLLVIMLLVTLLP
jgi:hypothetical protein